MSTLNLGNSEAIAIWSTANGHINIGAGDRCGSCSLSLTKDQAILVAQAILKAVDDSESKQ